MRVYASWRVHEYGSGRVARSTSWSSGCRWGIWAPRGGQGGGPQEPPGAASAGSPLRLPLDRVYPNACATQTLP